MKTTKRTTKPDDNKRNILFFEDETMRGLFVQMDKWQRKNRKRFHSMSIQNDKDIFCCIALTNPTEVIITDIKGNCAEVHMGYSEACLCVYDLRNG